MSKVTSYPSGENAARENKQPRVIDFGMEAYGCGRKNASSARQKVGKEVGLAVAVPLGIYAGIKAMGLGGTLINTGVAMMNASHFGQDVGYLLEGAAAWGSGAVAGVAGFVLAGASAYVGCKMLKRLYIAYENSSAAQKINPAMRKVGAFLSKNAQRAVEKTQEVAQRAAEKVIEHLPEKTQRMVADKTLTDNDIMHKGKYHHTAEQGGHRIKEFQVKLNKYREGY